MTKRQLVLEWTIEIPEYLSLLTNNDEALVAIVSKNGHMGYTQALLIILSEKEAKIDTIPHYIESVNISIDKHIKVTINPFFEQQLTSMIDNPLDVF